MPPASLRRRAVVVMAVSGFTRQEFVRRVGKPACGPIAVTPLGVERRGSTRGVQVGPPASPSFVCVGSVRPH